jgi:adenylyltransferase/sulfurtransferase
MEPGDADRFSRQIRFAPLGEAGQRRLLEARAVVAGMGALGSAAAALLLRSGVRSLRIIDRDIVEWSNLPRQTLYTERDAEQALPKVEAARAHLLEIDHRAQIEAHADDLLPTNASRLLAGADVIVDGLDNLGTRYLVNDFAVQAQVPWVYAGAIAGHGLVFPVRPGATACLRCLFPEPPEAAQMETCETAGVFSTLPALVAAVEAAEAIKLLAGAVDRMAARTLELDVWEGRFRPGLHLTRRADCPCCGARRFPFLEAEASSGGALLCGRDVVQVRPERAIHDLAALGSRLRAIASPEVHDRYLRFSAEGVEFTVFEGGRALLRGIGDVKRARSLYARYVGL